MSEPILPTDNDVAQAVTVTRRLLTRSAPYSRVELVALAALGEAFPAAPKASIAQQIGLDAAWDHATALADARRAPWWSEDVIDQIVGVLVAPLYGRQAK